MSILNAIVGAQAGAIVGVNTDWQQPNAGEGGGAPAIEVDLSAMHTAVTKSLAADQLTHRGLALSADGKYLYTCGTNSIEINEYILGTAWDISTAVHEYTLAIGGFETVPYGLYLKPDGTELFICGHTGDGVDSVVMDAHDLSTASHSQFKSLIAKVGNPRGLSFSPDGSKLYVLEAAETIHQYNLSTEWLLSSAVWQHETTIPSIVSGEGFSMAQDGSGFVISDGSAAPQRLAWCPMGTAFDASTVTFGHFSNLTVLTSGAGKGNWLKPDHTMVFVLDQVSTLGSFELVPE